MPKSARTMQRLLPVLALAVILLVGATLAAAEMESRTLVDSGPLAAADAVWEMGPQAGKTLVVQGDVETGIKLTGDEREASLARGGDGIVAEFRGGSLAADDGPRVIGKDLTIVVRASHADAARTGDLITWGDKTGKSAVRMSFTVRDSKPWLTAQWATDARPGPLELAAPLANINPTAWHDIAMRYCGARLELFVDGVLADEEWPLGSPLADGPIAMGSGAPDTAFHGRIDLVALWNRSLGDDELIARCGGQAGLAQRELALLGPELPLGQYWRPRGHNVHAGDCMPFFHDGRFHLFYLFDRRHHRSKWGLGAHQWAHASTTDLRQWEHHPLAVAITDPIEGSICTGSTFFHEGTYYAFYAIRMSDGSAAQLCAATSRDGIHFTKQPPLATLKAPYVSGPGRDPVVFRNPKTGLFHMLVTTELAEPPLPRRGGCLAQLVSSDLSTWEQREPFIVPGYPGQPECPDYFFWNGWYYLVFSNNGVARYRMSREPLGPWHRPKVDVFDGPQASVMKTAAFSGGRRLGAAFLGDGGYGGDVVFREILQHRDGTLGTRWPAELEPEATEPVALEFNGLTDGVAGDRQSVKLSAAGGLAVARVAGAADEYILHARVRLATGTGNFGLRWTDDTSAGQELRFEPAREKAGFRGADASSVDEAEHSSIYGVAGLDQPFEFELVVKRNLVDLCVDGRRTLVARLAVDGPKLAFFAHNADVTYEQIQLRPLVP